MGRKEMRFPLKIETVQVQRKETRFPLTIQAVQVQRKEVSLQKQRKVDNSRQGTLRQGSQGPFAPRQKPYEETVEEPEEMRQEMKLQGSATVIRAAPKMNCAK